MDKYCGNCKYFGAVVNKAIVKDDIHICNNNESMFMACLETATGCDKFEPQESEDKNGN